MIVVSNSITCRDVTMAAVDEHAHGGERRERGRTMSEDQRKGQRGIMASNPSIHMLDPLSLFLNCFSSSMIHPDSNPR